MSLPHSRTLIVDDQRSFQMMLKGMLDNLGFNNIDLCETGEQAAKFCAEKSFQLLLVDYNLGANKKNGRQLLEELRAKHLISTETVFIIVTGENSRSMVLGALENQPDDYIMKPFSQRQLHTRISHAQQKRQALQSVLRPLSEQAYDEAIKACNQLISNKSRYSNYCKNLIAEIFCKEGKFAESEEFLKELLAERDITWARLALAKSHVGMQRYEIALENLTALLEQHPLLLDAHDLKAQCLYYLDRPKDALQALVSAAEISPHSLERQKKIAQFARKLEQHELAKNAFQIIFELSKRSIHDDPEHLLNYVRGTFAAAEHTEEASQRHKYQHEAMTTLFQAQQENMYSDFALTTYKQLCQAKLDADKGHLIKAKKAYYKAINEVSNEHPEIDIPLQFAAECLNTLVILGEFEDAQKLAQKVANAANASGFTAEIIDKYQNDSEYQKRFTQFKQHHQDGSKYYAEGRYLEASTEYKAALSLAPTNSGAALNMIQCLLQLASKEKKQQSYLTECKEYFKLLDGIQLPRQQQERYQELKQSLNKLTQK